MMYRAAKYKCHTTTEFNTLADHSVECQHWAIQPVTSSVDGSPAKQAFTDNRVTEFVKSVEPLSWLLWATCDCLHSFVFWCLSFVCLCVSSLSSFVFYKICSVKCVGALWVGYEIMLLCMFQSLIHNWMQIYLNLIMNVDHNMMTSIENDSVHRLDLSLSHAISLFLARFRLCFILAFLYQWLDKVEWEREHAHMDTPQNRQMQSTKQVFH